MDNSEEYLYDDYYDYKDNQFFIPNRFCGDRLWVEEKFGLFNNSSPVIPIFSWCFQHAILAEIPVLFFLLSLPALFIQWKSGRGIGSPLPYDNLASMKHGLTCILVGDKLFILFLSFYEWIWLRESVPLVEFCYPLLQSLTLIGIFWASEKCRIRGLVGPGIVFCTWLLFVVTGIPEFYAWIKLGTDPQTVNEIDFYRYSAYLVWFPILCLLFVLHFFSGSVPQRLSKNESPEFYVSFINRQFFFWFDQLVSRGNKKPLTMNDIFTLDSSMFAHNLFKRWNEAWQKRITAYLRGKTPERQHHSRHSTAAGHDGMQVAEQTKLGLKQPLLNSKQHNHDNGGGYGATGSNDSLKPKKDNGKNQNAELPSIIATLFSLFKWQLIGATIVKLCSDLLSFANPLLLSELIAYIENPNAAWWYGYGIALGLFIASELRSIFLNNYFLIMNSAGVEIQSVLTAAVYAKTLKLSNAARQGRTVGEIVNLMAIDVERFQNLTPQIQQYWSSPLQIGVALFLLYRTIGWSVLGGLAIMVLLIPCNLFVSIYVKRWQVKQMLLKDERLKMTNEVLNGIRVIKLYAWELPMMAMITEIRRKEVELIQRASLVRIFTEVLNISSPFLVAIVTFTLYTLSSPDHKLTPQIAFVSLTLFSQLRMPMIIVAELIGQTIQTIVSNRRLKSFMVEEEMDESAVERDFDPEYERAIDVEFASFDWRGDRELEACPPPPHLSAVQHIRRPYTLNNIQLHVKKGILVTVVGQVGAGKTSLLCALLGEMHKIHGYVGVRGTLAYCPQQSWIQNRSVRANIIFSIDNNGLEGSQDWDYDVALYNRVLDACSLRQDLDVLPDGDLTEIGEKGINLSGGQKARIGLARALYQQADVYLLDDPLSAVDAIVGKHLFNKAIGPNSMLAGTTRILVSHSLAYLAESDLIVIIEDNQIKKMGTYSELLEDPQAANSIVYLEQTESTRSSTETEMAENADMESEPSSEGTSIKSRKKSMASNKSRKKSSQKPTETIKMIKDERAETGRVKFGVYMQYFKAMKGYMFGGFMLFIVLNSLFNVLNSFWLSDWSDDNTAFSDPSKSVPLGQRLAVYAIIGFSGVIALSLANMCQILGSVNASLSLHNPLLRSLMGSPISFFDTTPLGRVLNRFGKEFDIIDLRLGVSLRFLMVSVLMLVQVLVVIIISTPLFILIDIPITIIYILILRYFISTSRQLQRLTSITRSPLYATFTETIQGVTSVRAYGVTAKFFDEFCKKIDIHLACRYFSLVANRWLGIRLELIGNFIILSSAILAVVSKNWGTVTAGLIGLSVSKSLDITMMLGFLIRQISEVETNIVSMERVKEYSETPQEAEWYSPNKPPKNWPHSGEISIRNLCCRYRPELKLSLRNITANIRPREKIGVVGRTGSGKTSLSLALFRIIEPAEGQILIDGLDICTIGLHELRSKITVIPQDPVLFSGTLRFNLDPFNVSTDAELWTALEHAHLKTFVETQRDGLSHHISEGGDNISVGQRQLICLARAILRRSAVIVLDEATASIDPSTDALIQKTIRDEFFDSTVITIAHRISTIMDYDRIMVMEQGELLEFDTPKNLLADRRSLFSNLVASLGNANSQT